MAVFEGFRSDEEVKGLYYHLFPPIFHSQYYDDGYSSDIRVSIFYISRTI
jgi:hypothetical protein